MPQAASYLPSVRAQYEDYPYPPRAPEEERQRLLSTSMDCLDALNHYCYSGKRDFSRDFRVLVAGGGTGDALIFLAEQLRDTSAEVWYLDLSTASMQIAKDRAKIRGLSNIHWVHGSILDCASLLPGQYDYINCCGVLHHLQDPDAGLSALASVLKDDGAMGLMLYATYGRAGVYAMQSLMRALNNDTDDATEKLDRAKRLLAELPRTHLLSATRHRLNDIDQFGDPGIYDLFLHSQDRPYTAAQVHDFLSRQKLQLVRFLNTSDPRGNQVYNPTSYFQDASLQSLAASLPERSQHALAELLHSGLIKHGFYAKKQLSALPELSLEMVPTYTMCSKQDVYQKLYEMSRGDGSEVIFKSTTDIVRFPRTGNTELILKHLDGKRNLREIFKLVMKQTKAKANFVSLLAEFGTIYAAMNHPRNSSDWLMLHHESLPAYLTLEELQKRAFAA